MEAGLQAALEEIKARKEEERKSVHRKEVSHTYMIVLLSTILFSFYRKLIFTPGRKAYLATLPEELAYSYTFCCGLY